MSTLTQAPPKEEVPMIAVIGCDGSGKSSVSEHILTWVGQYGTAATVHLGKQSGNVERALSHLPLLGKAFSRLIHRKVKAVRARHEVGKQPSLLPALVISLFALRRRLRFKRMLALRRRGYIVVTDRYPQLAIPGAYDGPEFSTALQGGSRIVRWLARREHAMFEWMTSHRPSLVLRLNVDLDTACARKPDHRRESLAAKIAVTPLLSYNGAPIVDIDTNQPLADVLVQAETAVAKVMAQVRGAAKP